MREMYKVKSMKKMEDGEEENEIDDLEVIYEIGKVDGRYNKKNIIKKRKFIEKRIGKR
jgi:hypothetical protein